MACRQRFLRCRDTFICRFTRRYAICCCCYAAATTLLPGVIFDITLITLMATPRLLRCHDIAAMPLARCLSCRYVCAMFRHATVFRMMLRHIAPMHAAMPPRAPFAHERARFAARCYTLLPLPALPLMSAARYFIAAVDFAALFSRHVLLRYTPPALWRHAAMPRYFARHIFHYAAATEMRLIFCVLRRCALSILPCAARRYAPLRHAI